MSNKNNIRSLSTEKRLNKKVLQNETHENDCQITEEEAAILAKTVMLWICDNTLRLEFSVTHASALDAITEIIHTGEYKKVII